MKVVIVIKGGAIVDVKVPPELDVIIRDYDIDGVDPIHLDKDEDGNLYREEYWSAS